MRFIDRKVGVPICLSISCYHGFKKIFKKPCLIKSPDKILFIELAEMGSMVLAYPLFIKTKELYPQAELYFLTFKENRYAIDILKVLPEENVMTIDSNTFASFMFTTIRVFWQLRKRKISLAIDMEPFARFTTILTYLSGAKNRLGYFKYHNEGLYKGNFLTHRVPYNPHIHMAHNMLNLIHTFRSPQNDTPLAKRSIEEKDIILPKLKTSENDKNRLMAKLRGENKNILNAKKLILLNPNASDLIPLRRWSVENYIALAKRLLEQEGSYIVITGTQSERRDADFMCDNVNSERCINFAGRTTFSELIDLYNISDILITNDSGPAHFSTMTKINAVVLFGPETPKLYGPLGDNSHVFYANYTCSPCVSAFNHRKSACNNNKCLKAISVEEVYEKVRSSLDSINK